MASNDKYDPNPRWYVVHTYSGYENSVVSTVTKAAENRGMMKSEDNPNPENELILELNIPQETVTEFVDGKEKTTERKVFPGYVLIKMILNDESWHLVRNVRGVTGFVGETNKAIPLTDDEVRDLGIGRSTVVIGFAPGDNVKITDGAFEGHIGKIDSVDAGAKTVIVIVNMFGRDTPISLAFEQIQAI